MGKPKWLGAVKGAFDVLKIAITGVLELLC